jgi:hypothetical protein
MIPGYLDIPEKLRLKNEVFFNNAYFHGDYKYEWNEDKKILKVYCKRGNIFKNLLATYIGEKTSLDDQVIDLIKEENRSGFKKILLYQANLKTLSLRLIP